MKKLLVLFGLMFVIFACSNDCVNMVNDCLNDNSSEKNDNKQTVDKLTKLQDVVDYANVGEEIDLSQYELTDYSATINKKLTIKNGSLDNAKLQVKSEGVKLEKLTDLSVSTSSRLTISDSKLSDLLIGGNGETSRSIVVAVDMSVAMVSVTNCEIENVSLDGFNSQLNITDTTTKIDDIVISAKSKIILEAGSCEGMKDPKVIDGGEAVRVDMTKDVELSVLSIYSYPQKLEYNVREKIDLTGLVVMGTYSTTYVEVFKSDGKSEGEDTITKCEDEKDYTVECDLSKAGVSIVTITSKKNPEIKCSFPVFVKESQNADEEKPEEKIEITDVYLKIFGTAKTTYKVGERLDLSCYQVMGKYNGIKVNLPYTSEPANGAVLETAGENIEIKFHYDGGTLTQTIKVTEPWVVTFKDGEKTLYTLKVAGGELLKLPVVDERIGYTFGGWYKDDGTKIEAGDEVTGNITLYAKWKQTTFYVKSKADGTTGENADGTENNPFATIQDAVNKIIEVNDEQAEFTINVQSDINPDTTIFYENNNNYALININPNKALKLKICGTRNTGGTYPTISASSGGQQGRVMYIGNSGTDTKTTVTLENITLTAGFNDMGGGVYVGKGSTLTMNSGATIRNCEASEGNGGGVYVVESGELTMESGATIASCKAGLGGAVYLDNGSTFEMYGGTIGGEGDGKGCTATTDGGAVYITNGGSFEMTGGTIQNCEASLSGGGVWMNSGSSFTMSGNSKIEECTAISEGGGVYATDENNPCSFTMKDNATITGCTAQNYGGGGVSYGCGTNDSNIKFTMNGGTISDCSSSNGGGVYLYGCFEMNGGTISDNKASGYGGGVYLSDSTSSFIMKGGIIGKEITEGTEGTKQSWEYAATGVDGEYSNYAGQGGGGIYAKNGTVSIEGGKISYNYVPDPDGSGNPSSTQLKQGGGIFIEGGTLTLKNAEVSYNRGYQGGGVRCSVEEAEATTELNLYLDNATIKGNVGKYKGWSNFGGGLVIRKVTKVDFGTNPSIIEENYSADGGAVFIEDTTVTLNNITIKNNKYDDTYGGYRYGSEVLLFGGADVSINESPDNVKIASNEGETQGICIHADSNGQTNALNLSGNVKLDTPIYLVEKTKINITGDLTVDKVATITLDDTFTERTQVLQAGEGVTLSEQVDKFTVTPSSGTSWKIDSDGKLQKQ